MIVFIEDFKNEDDFIPAKWWLWRPLSFLYPTPGGIIDNHVPIQGVAVKPASFKRKTCFLFEPLS
jgi:hypothetical protein